jgi:hypothetical protein
VASVITLDAVTERRYRTTRALFATGLAVHFIMVSDNGVVIHRSLRSLPHIARSRRETNQEAEGQMAKNTITQITDDIDGSPDAETVSFGFQGSSYTIDLSAKNMDKLTKALAPFIEHATRNLGTASGRKANTKTGATPGRRYDLAQLREWAGKNKIEVPSRGRIPAAVVDRYLAAGGR